jgi:zinc transport system substrate-binding protein
LPEIFLRRIIPVEFLFTRSLSVVGIRIKAALFRFCLIALFIVPVAPVQAKQLSFVAGTTLLSDILQDLSGGSATIRTVIPGGACPGHYDLKPGDLRILEKADAVFLHPWQEKQSHIQTLIRAASKKNLRVLVVPIQGNWMVPDLQSKATRTIARMLSQIDPEAAPQYEKAMDGRTLSVNHTDRDLKRKLDAAGAQRTAVLCATIQKEFVSWAGFHIAGEYDRLEDLTPEKMAALVEKARKAQVTLVIDNVQSGLNAGRGMAAELGARQVNLSNFPGGLKSTETWGKSILKNVEILVDALQGLKKQES